MVPLRAERSSFPSLFNTLCKFGNGEVYFLTMNPSPRKKISLVLLGAYLTCFVLVELGHTHHQQRVFPETQALVAHACGEVELHRPLDWIGQCALCRDGHSRQQAAIDILAEFGLALNPSTVLFPPDESHRTEVRPHQGLTRGPPAT